MYSKISNLVIAFHGCDASVFKKVIIDGKQLKDSVNNYDWLGHGQYFWENNYDRAFQWAQQQSKKGGSIKEPAVIGAVIDLGYCMNLTDSKYIALLKDTYLQMKNDFEILETEMPVNKNIGNNNDLLLRQLDCAVIEYLHSLNDKNGEACFDSVRGVFIEGKPIYENSGIFEKTHIQICVKNPNCIKGYFRPLKQSK